MNKWQQKYCDVYYNGKAPRTKVGKQEFELLGKMKDFVSVDYGNRVEKYEITLDDCNMPEGRIDVRVLASNLRFWLFVKGFKVSTF